MEEINRTLAVLSTRTIDKGHCIRFQSKYHFPVPENGDRRYFAGKTDTWSLRHLMDSFWQISLISFI